MKDILGREVSDGSLVIGMTVDRHSDGMRFGIARGESCVWKHWGLIKSKPHNVYLVENPSEQELKIKQELIDEINKKELEDKQREEQRKALKRIPTKQLVIGGYYTDDKGYNWCYLGKATVKTIAICNNNAIGEPKADYGYCYISEFGLSRLWSSTYGIHVVPREDINVLKSSKRLVKEWFPKECKGIDLNNLKWTRVTWGDREEIVEIILD